jgi:hypothetical protein
MQIEVLPKKLREILTPDDIDLLTNLELLDLGDYQKFRLWLKAKNSEPEKLALAEERKLIRDRWATFKIIADDLEMTELSVRRAVDICFFLWNKKPLRDYSEESMLQNMEVNLARLRQKNKRVLRKDTEEKMKLLAKKYYYSSKDKRWYFRTIGED